MSNTPQTKKGLGTFDFFCVGFGAIVGVGWAVSLNKWMASAGGPIPAALGYLITLVLMVPVGLCFAELVPMLPVAGGTTAFTYRAFGEKASYVAGWLTLGAFLTLMPWEAIYVVDIASILFPALKAGAPLYVLAGSDIYLGHIVVGTIIALFFFYINYKGADLAAGLQKVLCIFLIGVGVLSMVCGLVKFDINNLMPVYENIGTSAHNSMFGGILAILASAPFFLAGFETIPQGIEDAGGDVASVGKTVVLSVVLACVFYAILLFCFGYAWKWQEFAHMSNPSAATMFKSLYPGAVGGVLYWLITLGAIAGLFTTWNGFFMASASLLMAMGRGNLVPGVFAKQNKNGIPVPGLLVCLLLSLIGPFLGAGLIGSITSFSLIRLRKIAPDMERPYKIPGGVAMGGFSALITTVVFILLFVPNNPVYMGKTASIMFVGWMVIGFILYAISGVQRKAISKADREAAMFGHATHED